MRISLLEKREDFYKILTDTLAKVEITIKEDYGNTNIYYVNKYLNFIATSDLKAERFTILVKEYSNSLKGWKRTIQKLYVWAAITPLFRSLLAHKKIKLPKKYSDFLILGGNHRLRLFSPELTSSYVILKKGESVRFIENEIKLKNEINLSYAPGLITSGKNWIQEDYFEGTPINRIQDKRKQEEITERVIFMHYKELLNATLEYNELNKFIETRIKEINSIIYNNEIRIEPDFVKNIEHAISILTARLTSNDPVPVSWSHGDLQMANILVSNDNFKVIDWEASAKRFVFYDLFVLLGEMRIHGNIDKAISWFEQKIKDYELEISLPKHWKQLLALEELVYAINEDCSAFFFISGKNIQKLCVDIVNISEK